MKWMLAGGLISLVFSCAVVAQDGSAKSYSIDEIKSAVNEPARATVGTLRIVVVDETREYPPSESSARIEVSATGGKAWDAKPRLEVQFPDGKKVVELRLQDPVPLDQQMLIRVQPDGHSSGEDMFEFFRITRSMLFLGAVSDGNVIRVRITDDEVEISGQPIQNQDWIRRSPPLPLPQVFKEVDGHIRIVEGGVREWNIQAHHGRTYSRFGGESVSISATVPVPTTDPVAGLRSAVFFLSRDDPAKAQSLAKAVVDTVSAKGQPSQEEREAAAMAKNLIEHIGSLPDPAIEKANRMAKLYLDQAKAALEHGDQEAAKTQAQRVVEKYPGTDAAKEAAEILEKIGTK